MKSDKNRKCQKVDAIAGSISTETSSIDASSDAENAVDTPSKKAPNPGTTRATGDCGGRRREPCRPRSDGFRASNGDEFGEAFPSSESLRRANNERNRSAPTRARAHTEKAFDTPSSPQVRARRPNASSMSTRPLLRRPPTLGPRLGKFCRPLWTGIADANGEHFLNSAPKPRRRW